MINSQTVKPIRQSRILKFGTCPQCNRKGLYHVDGHYCRCRYCGIYLISPPAQGSEVNQAPAPSFRERAKGR